MKRRFTILLAGLMALSLAACGSTQPQEQPQEQPAAEEARQSEAEAPGDVSGEASDPAQESQPEQEEAPAQPEESGEPQPEESQPEEAQGSGVLVAYFTYAENAALPEGVDASASASIQVWNGQTTGNAGVLASMIAQASGADLFSIRTVEQYPDTYDATVDQGLEEQDADFRPQMASHVENLEDYSVVFLVYPNWWGDLPMAVYSFLDEVDLTGKTVIPVVTSGGSGFSGTVGTIAELEPGAAVREGLSVGASSVAGAQERVEEWLAGLGDLA